MKMHKVRSSNIARVGYDPAERLLRVEFHRRAQTHATPAIYSYPDIDPQTYRELLEADSPGKYFSANIRGKPFTREA